MSSRRSSSIAGACCCALFVLLAILLSGPMTCTAVAGDLLRGGYTAAQGSGGTTNSFTTPSVAEARQNAQDMLARTTQAVQAVGAMQSAARQLAVAHGNNLGTNPNNPSQTLPDVPNGLNTGGLAPDSGLSSAGVANAVTSWQNAKTPTQTTTAGGEDIVTVVQTAPDAILNWSSFNIGKQTTLDFDQSAGGTDVGKWIAFNFIKDPSLNPSQILGSIQAAGQVYVINQNGIIFGGSSLVNVHTLVASSLPIDTVASSASPEYYYITEGLLNNPDDQFLFSAIAQAAGVNGSPALAAPASLLPNGADGNVTVQAGAEITAPANADNVGGRVALIGPNVTNDGVISTPDGQTILAAGLQVGFAASSDPTLRGLNVYVGAVSSSAYGGPAAGTATNGGTIDAAQGDAYMTGKNVDQLGVIASTTSVSLNGRIDLLADYGATPDPVTNGAGGSVLAPYLYQSTGSVEFGPESVSDILPETASTDTVVGSQLALFSTVMVQGQVIHLGADSTLLAPNANVTMDAGAWAGGTLVFTNSSSSSPQIYLDANAAIDVAGSTDVSASVTQNIIAVQLRGSELADDPLQRFGVFRGQTIYIDVRQQGVYDGVPWVGTPLANTTGYVGLIESTVGELTTAGGTVNLDSGGSVVMQEGSSVNVSGGYINYQGGEVDTTQVIAGGHIYDISEATPDMVYQGIFTGQFTVNYAKYGLTNTFTDPIMDTGHYEDGYVYGGAGGTVNIQAPSVVLAGDLVGETEAGPRQRQVEPAPSTFSLSLVAQQFAFGQYYDYSPTPPNIIIASDMTEPAADPFSVDSAGNPAPLRADEIATVILSPDLTESDGFGVLSVTDGDGKISVPAGTAWTAPVGGSISLAGANVTIDGSITVPQGKLSFTAYDISPYELETLSPTNPTLPAADPTRGDFVLGSGAELSTAGLLVDDRIGSATADTLPEYYSGGSVMIASYNADLMAGSGIDVSGGVDLSTNGKPTYGTAGSISIKAGKDPLLAVLGGRLVLDGALTGYSGGQGGSLTLQDSFVQIGGAAPNGSTLALSPGFFDQGGFASFTIDGVGGLGAQPAIYITPGTQIDAVAENYVLAPDTETGNGLELVPTLLSEQSRTPVSLSFKSGATSAFGTLLAIGSIAEGEGAGVQVDPGGTVSFSGNTVDMLGSVIAPGGTISISGATDSTTIFLTIQGEAVPTVELGPNSLLSTAGAVIPTANNKGFNTGIVLNGGSISISGNIVAERGAVLNVSGISATLDRAPQYGDLAVTSDASLLGAALVQTLVESNGGSISMEGGQELFTDATLLGAAGGSAAMGGSLTIGSGRFYAPNATQLPTDVTLTVTQDGLTVPASLYASGGSAIGSILRDKNGNIIEGGGYFAVSSFESSGMDSLTLVTNGKTVDFSGPVTITANDSISVANGGVLEADGAVKLEAPYVEIGEPFKGPLTAAQLAADADSFFVGNNPYYFNPTGGTGSLTVIASLIDIGDISLQGISNVALMAENGDIRGDGTLDVAGNILLQAGQIYPPTETTFNIIAYGGTVTIASGGERQLPLSAGGTLNIYASKIIQDGVLRAPLGTINLGWNGSGSSPQDPLSGAGYVSNESVPVAQQITLGRGSITSVSAIDPLTGQGMILPYGSVENATSWIDPSGTDITSGGVPQKSINISGENITDSAGATIDISGGGDLLAYEFVSGVGGTVDILASNSSYAIIPGYGASFAPYAPYDTAESKTTTANPYNPNGTVTDAGYTNPNLQIGSQVYLSASPGLAAGFYTLLPARYALLPGAFLVTPQPGTLPVGTAGEPDGSMLVSGYAINGLDRAQTGQPLTEAFLVDSQAVVLNEAQYSSYYGNSFLTVGAVKNGQPVPRLPKDGGQLTINATASLSIAGMLEASTPSDGGGALVDITTSNPEGILIAGPGVTGASGQLVLDVSALNSFGAGSLLIGGVRSIGANGTDVTVDTSEIQVDNGGDPLIGSDIILAATGEIILGNIAGTSGADIESSGAAIGGSDITINGNGVALRVSGNPALGITRTGVTANNALLQIGDGSKISGASVVINSSQSATVGTGATITGKSVAIGAGLIALNLNGNAPATGLVLSAPLLETLAAGAESLSLLSYNAINIYGGGEIGATSSAGVPALDNITLNAGAINGFGSAEVTFNAKNILIGNAGDTTTAADPGAETATLEFNGKTITLGANQTNIGDYSTVVLNASGEITSNASGGLSVDNGLMTQAQLITAAKGATETITAGGALDITPSSSTGAVPAAGGAGASLTFVAASIDDNGDIALPAGDLTLHATTGGLTLGDISTTSINVGGIAQQFFNVTKYTGGGQVSLMSDQGAVDIGSKATVTVSADAGGGNAGTVTVSAPEGAFTLGGSVVGNGGAGGVGGNFNLDAGDLADAGSLAGTLNTDGFTQALDFRVRNTPLVTVASTVDAASFQLSVDNGSIDVTGEIDADGVTGGTVILEASSNITIEDNATISAVGQTFDSAGQGGSVSLETTGGRIDIATGSTINLSVTAAPSGPGALQDVTGTLYLKAPQVDSMGNVIAVNAANAGSDLDIAAIDGTIVDASSITAAGAYTQDAATTGVASIDAMEAPALANASAFMANALAANVSNRIIGGNASINASTFYLEPAENIENSQGGLILNQDWDLSTARYGTAQAVVDQNGNAIMDNNGNPIMSAAEPGFLTLRAEGSITFNGSLTDGFGDGAGALDEPTDSNGFNALWLETLLPYLKNGSTIQAQRSWSYQITAGADFTAANESQVMPSSAMATDQGSVLIGQNDGFASSESSTDNTAIDGFYQVIRTGAGSIGISAAANVELLNQFATVYSAGALVTDPTLGGAFQTPILFTTYTRSGAGRVPLYPAQYTMGGGNVSIITGGDIEHLTVDLLGNVIPDSERQLPDDWLLRRGDLATDGDFDTGRSGDVESTTWWIDFSNFFEGVGALGGGNVTMEAGGSINNVDAVVPTNARMPGDVPNASSLVELGGGNLLVESGQNINGGVYYVENGDGVLDAGASILTNSTRSPSITILGGEAPTAPDEWLATTLFLGNGSFDVTARGDLLLGPVANPFLLPGGLQNSYWYKSYFSTYGADDSVDVTSLGGDVELREGVTVQADTYEPALEAWYENELLLSTPGATAAYYQPWLQTNETYIFPFATLLSVMPPALRVTAFSGDVDLVGNITLSPAPDGTLEIEAEGSINGLQPNGESNNNGQIVQNWAATTIDLSDANPADIPGIANPLGYQSIVGKSNAEDVTGGAFLTNIDDLFNETGSTEGVAATIQTKQALHDPDILHADDTEPLLLYAVEGDLSGVTLYSAKEAEILVGQDITDIGLYIQNDSSSNVSVVSAGRDIIAYDPLSPLRDDVLADGNLLDVQDPTALAGDIQISGPGTLEVLAGRNLTAGDGPENSDGTSVGITSIGNGRNPYLPFDGAQIIVAAGLGSLADGLEDSTALDWQSFDSTVLSGAAGSTYFADLGVSEDGVSVTSEAAFEKLSKQQQAIIGLDLFYLVLRDAGREHNIAGSPGSGNYDAATAAIDALLGSAASSGGDIDLTSKEIKTESGGDIDIIDPSGQLTVGIALGTAQPVDQGILTEDGGNISIYTQGSVNLGTSRIFTLKGGNIVIWSNSGNIAAGESSKTVQSAPPTRVLVDPQSADVETDLAGLATGGGIGVLATVAGVAPGSVDLIAPMGVIDAGDAGIRATGDLNLAATQILNASNIQAAGASTGVPVVTVSAPNIGAISAASAAAGAGESAANQQTANQNPTPAPDNGTPSIIDVEVLGYGGGDSSDEGG
jgi:filamentous hemagglutinin family protein